MNPSPLRHIRVLSDGRPGHENQSVGLALALARRTGASHEIVRLDPKASLLPRLRAAATGAPAQLIVAAGHRTHLPLWWAARRADARSVVIMRPSLPSALFDLALIPRHDLAPGAKDTPRRILTRGALNRVPETLPAKTASGLVLLGGPSKHHGWDAPALAPLVARVIAARPDLTWTVADSRRTPEDFLSGLELPENARRVPWRETTPGWLAAELARAAVVWATEDSVSMVHEAVTARAATGVLPVPIRGAKPGRPVRAVTGLIADGYTTAYENWLAAGAGALASGPALHEAGRCADRIVAAWFAPEISR
jgi:mitochondrial fission protein ELM1